MFSPTDIIVRKTSGQHKVWLSQNYISANCGLSAEWLWVARHRYLAGTFTTDKDNRKDILLKDTGRSWRWARIEGRYYYDLDRIPNRKPALLRDRLPSKEELIGKCRKTGETAPAAKSAGNIPDDVLMYVKPGDVEYYLAFTKDGRSVFNNVKAQSLAQSAAWCRFLKHALSSRGYKQYGFGTKKQMLDACAQLIKQRGLEGLGIRTGESLRKKLENCPDEEDKLLDFLVSGKYCNANARVVGRDKLVDRHTGEILAMDRHETVMMTYWLNPGRPGKYSCTAAWKMYRADMERLGIRPVGLSTFSNYVGNWANRVLSSKERHGVKFTEEKYKPYIPAAPLEYANSLWAADASGIIPYRYRHRNGKWKVMKLYVLMVTDAASRCIAGYSCAARGGHYEDGKMLADALRMALRYNGTTRVLDFVSDNHGAYTNASSRELLQTVFRNVRTISPGNSRANPAETMFRLFKRHFKARFAPSETSWDATGIESRSNADYFEITKLPTYEEATRMLAAAVEEWNNTAMSNGLSPLQWFRDNKNPKAGSYSGRHYRMITGEFSRRNLTYSRGILEVERDGTQHRFEIPSDSETLALIARQTGYNTEFRAHIYWDAAGADVYTEGGRYMFHCPPAMLASKTPSEADSAKKQALAANRRRVEVFEEMVNDFENSFRHSREVLVRDYQVNISAGADKEQYNFTMNSAMLPAGAVRAGESSPGELPEEEPGRDDTQSIAYHKARITDFQKYM